MKNIIRPFSLLFIAGTLSLTACKKDKVDPVDPESEVTAGAGTLNFHFDSRFGTDDFVLNKAFANQNGDSVKISEVEYFISNVELVKADGSTTKEAASYHLIQVTGGTTKEEFLVKNIPAGQYTKLRFMVGIDSVHNSSAAYAEGDLSDHLAWDWNTGYIFLKTSGQYLSTATPKSYQPFGYEVGKNYSSRIVEIPLPTTTQIDDTHNPKVHLHANLKNIFGGPNVIDVKANPTITGEPKYKTVSGQVADNYAGMFRIDHVHAH
jgi:hypothetical protein